VFDLQVQVIVALTRFFVSGEHRIQTISLQGSTSLM